MRAEAWLGAGSWNVDRIVYTSRDHGMPVIYSGLQVPRIFTESTITAPMNFYATGRARGGTAPARAGQVESVEIRVRARINMDRTSRPIERSLRGSLG